MTLRVYCSSHTHDFCFLSFTQETEPVRTTNSRSNENGQDNILATQCAAVAEQPATEVATTTDAARDPTVAPPSVAPPRPLDLDAFRTGLDGGTRNEEAARRSKTRAVDTIVNAIVSVGT